MTKKPTYTELEQRIRVLEEESIDSKKAEESLRVKNWAIESAINAIAISDLEGNLNYVNPAFLKLWGYSSPTEILGKSAVEFWQMAEKASEVMEAVHSGRGWSGEIVGKNREGLLFDVQVQSSLVMSPTGQPICMLASFLDITQQKRAEAALRESEAKYSGYVENAPDGVFIADDKARYLEVNKAACLMTGYSEEELLKMSISDLLSENFLEEGLANFGRLNEIGRSHAESQFKHKDGSRRWWSVDAVKISESRYVGFTKDITERKQAEVALAAEKHRLTETNTALQVILKQRYEDRKEIEKKIIDNIRELVLPHLEKLRNLGLNSFQTSCLDLATANLQQVTSPFMQNITTCYANFTQREIQVANMVRTGINSKEIANILNISTSAVEFHRDNIRKKLRLNQKKTNLYTFLIGLSE